MRRRAAASHRWSLDLPSPKGLSLAALLATTAGDLREFAPLFAELQRSRCRTTLGSASRIEQDRNLFEQITEL